MRLVYVSIFLVLGLLACKHEPQIMDTPPNPVGGTVIGGNQTCDSDTIYFVKDIQPLLAGKCGISGCHGANNPTDGIILTDYVNVINTGGVKAFDANGSKIYELITESDLDKRMPPPPASALSFEETEMIRIWIEQGALNNDCNENGCDSTNISFSSQVWPMLNQSCVSCHSASSPAGGVTIADYKSTLQIVNDSSLLGSITHDPNYSPMPQGGMLANCEIAIIRNWINEGAQNN